MHMKDAEKFCSMLESLSDSDKVDCTWFSCDLECICDELKAYILADIQEVCDGLYETPFDSLNLHMAFDRLDSLFDLLDVLSFVVKRNQEIPIVFNGSIEKDKKE